jgi:hypothetical protein
VGTVYADAYSQTEAVDALAAEARRLRADAIYGVRESDLPGLPRRPGRAGTGSTPGDYSSERHMRSWQATAVILEPAAPADREAGEDPDDPQPEETP